jgi:hypothetical protein
MLGELPPQHSLYGALRVASETVIRAVFLNCRAADLYQALVHVFVGTRPSSH